MDLGIAGRVALVTGADSGIGKATAQALLDEGVRVAISDRAGGDLDRTLAELKAAGEMIAAPADVTEPAEVTALLDRVKAELGAPDILVHAAGVTGATGDFLTIGDRALC